MLVLLVFAAVAWSNFSAFVFSGINRHNMIGGMGRAASLKGHRQVELTMLRAKGGESEADTIELGGFSGFVVGLALLPYVLNALGVTFGILFSGNSFELGPFGLTLVSCLTTCGITFWSIGSFFDRGRGLPAGPLGFLGLAEGLSYLGTFGLIIAAVLTTARAPPAPTGVPPPAATVTQAKVATPTASTPPTKAPSTPVVQAPAMPAVQAPAIKVPEFKAPDFKVPSFPKQEEPKKEEPKKEEPKKAEAKKEEPKKEEPKKAEVKKEEPKKEEPKKEEPKKPEVKKEEPKKPEVKAPEPKKEESKKPADMPNYDSLFD